MNGGEQEQRGVGWAIFQLAALAFAMLFLLAWSFGMATAAESAAISAFTAVVLTATR